jgi:HPt (histidine-containing phosphotransfer) domain-containing protein
MSAGDSRKGSGFELLTPLMDVPSTLKRLGNDVELFNQIVEIYLEDAPELYASARRAIAESDAASLRRAAHSLKGLAATMSASQAMGAALRLEQLGAANDLDEAPQALEQLNQRLCELNVALEAYRQQVEAQHRQGHAIQTGS